MAPAQQRAVIIPEDDVAFEMERHVGFGFGPFQLELGPKGKNVVRDAVLLTVVLVEATGFRVVHEVSLHHDVG